MPEVSTRRSTVRRLRGSVDSRTLEGRGIAVSAGRTAVVVDGAAAEHLWAALEPVLRAGTDPQDLLERLPAAARPAAARLIEQLEEHALLCSGTPIGEGPLAAHIERIAPDPEAALAAAGRALVRITGTDAGFMAQVLEAFDGTGLRVEVPGDQPVGDGGDPIGSAPVLPGTGGEVVLTLGDVDAPSSLDGSDGSDGDERVRRVLVARAGDWRLVGPAPQGPEVAAALGSWVRARSAEVGPAQPARDRIADRLAATQAVIDVLDLIAGPGDAADGYHLTSPDVVSETQALPVLPALGATGTPLDLPALLSAPPRAQGAVSDALQLSEPLWLGALTAWDGPVPGALPQVPVGLARAGVRDAGVVEAGLDTAGARAACLERLVALTHGDRDGVDGVASDTLGAAARAVTDWSATALTWADDQPGPAPGTPFTRRYWSSLTLREGVVAHTRLSVGSRVDVGRPDAELVRVDVLDDAGTLLGSGIAPGPEDALAEALIPAIGAAVTATATASHDAPSPDPRPRLESTERALLAWAAAVGLGILLPDGAAGWAEFGLVPVRIADLAVLPETGVPA